MAYFQLGERQHPLKQGTQRIGPEDGADIRLPSGEPSASATVTVNPDQSVVIQRAGTDSVVKVNGVMLGAEPSPLIHGDRVELAGHDLRFGDTKQSGSTQFVSSSAVAEVLKARTGLPAKPTTATGGRLISLVDGREYAVPGAGLTIGRDPSADIVVPATEVSRRHVQIAPGDQGYVLTDLSTNGVLVNGVRVAQQQVLGRSDVIKVANEEFRFYADKAPAPAAPAPAPSPDPAPLTSVAAPPAPSPSPNPAPLTSVAAPPAPSPSPDPAPLTSVAAPPAPSPSPNPAPLTAVAAPPAPSPSPNPAPLSSVGLRPALAILEILNEGPHKGQKLEVRSPLTTIGRGPHNDLVVASESVSDSHAKLQKRDSGWCIVDIDSTNGTYVGGRRVKGEQMLEGAPDLRFGDIKVAFRPNAEATEPEKGTRAIAGVSVEEARRVAARRSNAAAANAAAAGAAAPAPAAVRASAPASTPVSKGGSTPPWVWLLAGLVVIGAVAAYFLRGA